MILIQDRFCDIAMLPSSPEEKTEMENLLNLSFVGCDCDRSSNYHPAEFMLNKKDSGAQKTRNLRVLTDEAVASDRASFGPLSIDTLLTGTLSHVLIFGPLIPC